MAAGAFLDQYELTVRLRDEAAARIRAAGDRPDGGDLTRWEQAHDEVAVMKPIVREMAAPYVRLPGLPVAAAVARPETLQREISERGQYDESA
ncbi:hypothetical protein FXF51_01810 [Nonomuraea sp. PA05]|uniref:hypothetical protein n=1 Tax=Nonomuraea sp. PA05 TaxID=2604466 RepID=UPI0011DB8E9A|nr:hypothetical protein [Nonomuraea sp. PA05]TYB71197.1 hypothetical protein FXF51_01810 [Nonomuraea sp. PA05]